MSCQVSFCDKQLYRKYGPELYCRLKARNPELYYQYEPCNGCEIDICELDAIMLEYDIDAYQLKDILINDPDCDIVKHLNRTYSCNGNHHPPPVYSLSWAWFVWLIVILVLVAIFVVMIVYPCWNPKQQKCRSREMWAV